MGILYGRDQELALVHDLVERAGERGGALVVRGEPGIGKSALLEAATGRAARRAMAVSGAAGVQAETHLPFAGLHQLLMPLLGSADALPARQREALLGAFGMGAAESPQFFLIALAALNLLGEAAARGPLLVTIDDVQWLDRSTVDVLGFVARRLASEPIALVMALRDGYPTGLDECGLPELRLRGLPPEAAGALLDARSPRLAAGMRRRVLAEAAGNPLALVELPLALESAPAKAEFLPLTARLERAFAARTADLPAATRSLLLAAAADDGDGLADVLAAAEAITGAPVPPAALAPAVEAGLVRADERTIRFRHPLVRSAIYQRAEPAERLAAHAALAEVHAGDPDRRAWHRAAATGRRDEGVARELQSVALRARARGAITVAVAALQRSAELSERPAERGRRLLHAAELAFELGRADLVAALLGQVEPPHLGAAERAGLTWLREMLEEEPAAGAPRVVELLETAERGEAAGDRALALNIVRAAAVRCWWADPGWEVRARVVAAAERLAEGPGDPRLLAVLGLAAPAERGADVIERLAEVGAAEAPGADAAISRLRGQAATAAGAFDLSVRFFAASIAELRAQGRLGLLAQTLVSQAYATVHGAEWTVATLAAEEAERLARETGQPRWVAAAQTALALLAGLRGEQRRALALAAEAERTVLSLGNRFGLALLQHARGVIALSSDRHAEAYAHLRRVFDPADPVHHPFVRCWLIGDLAEAAIGAGQRDGASAAVRELEKVAERTPAPILHIGLRHARALLAEDDAAEPHYREALDADLTAWPVARARLLLAYGNWLRRRRRTVEARTPLRLACEAFDALGLPPWGERARRALRAAGEATVRRDPPTSERLTAQELQIARLAADGLSNREIGQMLYLSHRTVGTHLYRLFPKLGITSRAQLRDALGPPAPGPGGAGGREDSARQETQAYPHDRPFPHERKTRR